MKEITIKAKYYPMQPPKFIGQFPTLDIAMGHAARKKMEGYRVMVNHVAHNAFNVLVNGKMDSHQPVGARVLKARIQFIPLHSKG